MKLRVEKYWKTPRNRVNKPTELRYTVAVIKTPSAKLYFDYFAKLV